LHPSSVLHSWSIINDPSEIVLLGARISRGRQMIDDKCIRKQLKFCGTIRRVVHVTESV